MSTYPEMKSGTYRVVGGISYFVQKFGLNGVVYEEKLVPMPTEKVIRTMNPDGTEDEAKRETIPLIEPKEEK